MTAAEDHVLEYALGRVLGRSDAELTARILDGCRRADPAHRGSNGGRHTRRRAAAAAAALVLIAVGAVWGSSWLSQPVAVSDDPVLSVRGKAWQPSPRTSFECGDVLVADDHVIIRLTSGATVTARPRTVLRVDDGAALTLSLGSAVVASGAAGLLVATPCGSVHLAPRARVRLDALAPEYALAPHLTTVELARRIHMIGHPLVLSIAATLLQGTGELAHDGETRALSAGVTVRQDAQRDDAGIAQLRKQIGSWKITTVVGGREYSGTEVCRPGSGDHSVVSDIAVDIDGRRIESTELLSYDPRRRRYSGIYADSFGGELGLLLGSRTEDLKKRVLQVNKFHGGEFGIRITTRWISDDERHTAMETLRDGKWETRREMVHRRQPEAPSKLFQVILNVRDMQRQVAFYRDALGLTVVDPEGGTDFSAHTWVRLSSGGMSLALHAGRGSPNTGEEARLSFRVEDLETAGERVKQAGMPVSEVRSPAPGVKVVDARDPEGNVFHLEAHSGK